MSSPDVVVMPSWPPSPAVLAGAIRPDARGPVPAGAVSLSATATVSMAEAATGRILSLPVAGRGVARGPGGARLATAPGGRARRAGLRVARAHGVAQRGARRPHRQGAGGHHDRPGLEQHARAARRARAAR